MDKVFEIEQLKTGIRYVEDRITEHRATIHRLQAMAMGLTKELADLEEEVLTTEKSGKSRKRD